MNSDVHQRKIDAIYDLRAAVESKALAQQAVDSDRTPETRDAFLDALVLVEEKTQDAIDACGECGHTHPSGTNHHLRAAEARGNVIDVDFRPKNDYASMDTESIEAD